MDAVVISAEGISILATGGSSERAAAVRAAEHAGVPVHVTGQLGPGSAPRMPHPERMLRTARSVTMREHSSLVCRERGVLTHARAWTMLLTTWWLPGAYPALCERHFLVRYWISYLSLRITVNECTESAGAADCDLLDSMARARYAPYS